MENPFDVLAKRQDEIESKLDKILTLVQGRPLEAWCSVEIAAERTGVSRRQIEEAYLTGELGYTKKGRSVRLSIDEINAWMRKDYITPAEVKSGAKRVVLEADTIAQKGYTFIYLMHDPHSGLHKIGRSVTPEVRERTLVSQMPSIEIIFTSIECRIQKEKELHKLFAAKRVRGEWFKLHLEDIDTIRNYNYAE